MVRPTLALAAVLSVASISLAGDLVTAPVFVGSASKASCILVNITSAPITAQLQMLGADGSVLSASLPETVGAGQLVGIGVLDPGTFVYCRFVKASKGKVRATLTAAPSAATAPIPPSSRRSKDRGAPGDLSRSWSSTRAHDGSEHARIEAQRVVDDRDRHRDLGVERARQDAARLGDRPPRGSAPRGRLGRGVVARVDAQGVRRGAALCPRTSRRCGPGAGIPTNTRSVATRPPAACRARRRGARRRTRPARTCDASSPATTTSAPREPGASPRSRWCPGRDSPAAETTAVPSGVRRASRRDRGATRRSPPVRRRTTARSTERAELPSRTRPPSLRL